MLWVTVNKIRLFAHLFILPSIRGVSKNRKIGVEIENYTQVAPIHNFGTGQFVC